LTAARGDLVAAAGRVARATRALRFGPPVACVYAPLDYARAPHRDYLRRYGRGRKKVLLLGMNPGPFGMAQTGVPFGEVAAVRDWLGVCGDVEPPASVHPSRPVLGFDCPRSEVSGRRLWGLLRRLFGTPERFFATWFVHNYCPLAFVDAGGRNLTPDRLRPAERDALFAVCDEYLRDVTAILQPELVIGVGGFAEHAARRALAGNDLRIGRILHPSPASPAANRGWEEAVLRELAALGVLPPAEQEA
jgi:single-strand selective monofunctional uracil DNA glycosylase